MNMCRTSGVYFVGFPLLEFNHLLFILRSVYRKVVKIAYSSRSRVEYYRARATTGSEICAASQHPPPSSQARTPQKAFVWLMPASSG